MCSRFNRIKEFTFNVVLHLKTFPQSHWSFTHSIIRAQTPSKVRASFKDIYGQAEKQGGGQLLLVSAEVQEHPGGGQHGGRAGHVPLQQGGRGGDGHQADRQAERVTWYLWMVIRKWWPHFWVNVLKVKSKKWPHSSKIHIPDPDPYLVSVSRGEEEVCQQMHACPFNQVKWIRI